MLKIRIIFLFFHMIEKQETKKIADTDQLQHPSAHFSDPVQADMTVSFERRFSYVAADFSRISGF